MATSVSSALDKIIDVTDRLDPALFLQQGQPFDYALVLDTTSGDVKWATLAQFRAGLIPPNAPNQSPVVTLAISQNGIQVGQSTVFTATASDPDGVIVAGTFTIDGVPVAVLPTGPFTFTYTPTSAAAVGTHQIAFTGLDNGGATATATLPLVVVAAPTSPAPVPQLTFAPVGNKTVGAASVTLSATSTNTVTPITFVSSNGAAVAVTNSGGVYTATFPAAGTSTLTALQMPGNGYAAGNASQVVTVSAVTTPTNQPPNVALEADSPTIPLGQSVGLFATANDPDSGQTITLLEIFEDNTLTNRLASIANSNTLSYSYKPGTTGLKRPVARATDSSGATNATTVSQPAPVQVNGVPTFALTLDPSGVYARDTLTLDPASQCIIGYNNPVQTSATAPGSSTMYICFPTINDVIGQLDFDPADAGHLCEAIIGTTHYQKNATTGQALSFTNGNALLAV